MKRALLAICTLALGPVCARAQDPDFDGIDFSSMILVADGSSPLAVEFFFPFRMMRCFATYDCTGQQLLDSGTVVINGERSALDLQVAEGKN